MNVIHVFNLETEPVNFIGVSLGLNSLKQKYIWYSKFNFKSDSNDYIGQWKLKKTIPNVNLIQTQIID